MSKIHVIRGRNVAAFILASIGVFSLDAVHAGGLSVLYSFHGGTDGSTPFAGVLRRGTGTLYGTTTGGGASNAGTVFKLAPDGIETVLYAFTGGNDGSDPSAALIADKAGNLFGTTVFGGAHHFGAVFKLAPDGTESVLYSFAGQGGDGEEPRYGLIADTSGNLYGTTPTGGTDGFGTFFGIASDGAETVIHYFYGGYDGAYPDCGLIADKAGHFYGTTTAGGTANAGTVFRVTPNGKKSTLYNFAGGSDGAHPYGNLIADTAGNLYGTTSAGGELGEGTVYKLTPGGIETVLHSFKYGRDGGVPLSGLVVDSVGNVYGTTTVGGAENLGTVFKIAPDGTKTVLHSFGSSGGATPRGELVADKNGNLFGTTSSGGAHGAGAIFKIKE